MLTMSEDLANRVTTQVQDLPAQISSLVRLSLTREASPGELRVLSEYAQTYGLANTCRLLFNLNEFVFID